MDIKKTSTIHFEDFVLNIYENIHNVILFKEQEILDIFGLKFFVNCNYKKYHINVISLNTEYCIFEYFITKDQLDTLFSIYFYIPVSQRLHTFFINFDSNINQNEFVNR